MRLDALVWAFTDLFPSSMRGLFDSSSVVDSYDKDKKHKITDLHADLYAQVNNSYNPYSLVEVDENDEGGIYL